MASNVIVLSSSKPKTSEPTFQPEVVVSKVKNKNVLTFGVRPNASVLLSTVQPINYDHRTSKQIRCSPWIKLMESMALIPSTRTEAIFKLAQDILKIIPANSTGNLRSDLQRTLDDIISTRSSGNSSSGTLDSASAAAAVQKKRTKIRSTDALKIKDRVARCLRKVIADPINVLVFRKDVVIDRMLVDDKVSTPLGTGYLRSYRSVDHMCIVVFSWGHGFISKDQVLSQEQVEAEKRRLALKEIEMEVLG